MPHEKKHTLTILQLQARPSYYHYSFNNWTFLPLCNAMSNTPDEAESNVFKVKLAKQILPVIPD